MKNAVLIIPMLVSLNLLGCASGSPSSSKRPGSQTTSETTTPKPNDSSDKEVITPGGVAPDVACEQQGRYYDLALSECTQRKLMNVTCTLDNVTYPGGSDFVKKNPDATKDFTDEVQKIQIRTLFKESLAGYTLRYCVDDPDDYTLVAVKQDGSKYLVEEIPVPK